MSLLKNAKIDLLSASDLYEKMKTRNIDEQYLNNICYHLQQCLEKCLKTIIEEIGKQKYDFTHDIFDLCLTIDNLNDIPEEIENIVQLIKIKANMYTTWENKTRYYDNFVELKENVNEAFDICKKLVTIIETIQT